MAGKVIEPIKGDANGTMRVSTVDQLAKMTGLSLRQYQAGIEIRDAWSGVEMLSSGSPLQEQVDSTPKPDATIAHQMDAQSRLVNAMKAVPSAMRAVIERVCWHNMPLERMGGGSGYYRRQAVFYSTLDSVADHLRY
jgi:hypothetical protein